MGVIRGRTLNLSKKEFNYLIEALASFPANPILDGIVQKMDAMNEKAAAQAARRGRIDGPRPMED